MGNFTFGPPCDNNQNGLTIKDLREIVQELHFADVASEMSDEEFLSADLRCDLGADSIDLEDIIWHISQKGYDLPDPTEIQTFKDVLVYLICFL